MSSVVYDNTCWDERKFKIIADHKPLEIFFARSKEIPKNASVRTCRCAIALMAFDNAVVYQEDQEGRMISHADAMSRLHFQTNVTDELEDTNVYSEVNFSSCKTLLMNEFKAEHLTYPLIHTVIKRIISGKRSHCSQQKSLFMKLKHFLTIENDLVYNGTRPFVGPRL